MERAFVRTAVTAALALAVSSFGEAGVKTEEKTRVQLGGPLGGMLSLFGGGKAAKEGIVTTTAVVGERRLVKGGDAGQIVDLAEGKIYDLDLKKKTYTRHQLRRAEAALRGGAREGREGSREGARAAGREAAGKGRRGEGVPGGLRGLADRREA